MYWKTIVAVKASDYKALKEQLIDKYGEPIEYERFFSENPGYNSYVKPPPDFFHNSDVDGSRTAAYYDSFKYWQQHNAPICWQIDEFLFLALKQNKIDPSKPPQPSRCDNVLATLFTWNTVQLRSK